VQAAFVEPLVEEGEGLQGWISASVLEWRSEELLTWITIAILNEEYC
jgi:hypothetical protein